ncbi:3-hydroxyacyl-CoA dehydrogenase family protein [Brevibacillus fluminis]|uniref:3-hydroxyacyl-CoA dehydrogenase family protein n=1 Tax=Brevibacillus fluminis TaxID=511487 RepID=UPI003F89686C
MRKRIALIGSGMMGTGIAQIFAQHSFDVTIFAAEDADAQIMGRIQANLLVLQEGAVISAQEAEDALARITIARDLPAAVDGQEFVIECAPENMELKQQLFATLDELCDPSAILATNTSVMSITQIAGRAKRRERIVGTHFWNPPFLIPLVEVIRAADTAEDVMQRTIGLLRAVGKHPVRVNKDEPGFVANRLQHALWREAISIVERGIADAATVDECIRYGFGLRLPVLGPLENADMVGTDLTLAIHSYLLAHLENSTEPSRLLVEKVESGELGFKAGKGFFDWTPDQAEQSRQRLIQHLINTK